jgi:excisionase family DNA binding protein
MRKRKAVEADRLCTAKEAAAILGVHFKTVRYWVRLGLLRKVPIGKIRYRIARSELDRFIADREMAAGTGATP